MGIQRFVNFSPHCVCKAAFASEHDVFLCRWLRRTVWWHASFAPPECGHESPLLSICFASVCRLALGLIGWWGYGFVGLRLTTREPPGAAGVAGAVCENVYSKARRKKMIVVKRWRGVAWRGVAWRGMVRIGSVCFGYNIHAHRRSGGAGLVRCTANKRVQPPWVDLLDGVQGYWCRNRAGQCSAGRKQGLFTAWWCLGKPLHNQAVTVARGLPPPQILMKKWL